MLTTLYPWQERAVEKLRKIKVGALYMEQGTGKTRTTLELIKLRKEKEKIAVVLWLCPCSVKGNLKEDIKKHCGRLPEWIIVKGIESLSSSDRLYLLLLELIRKYETYLVVDESNLVKNIKAIRTGRIIEIAKYCSYKLILNGTPVSKNEADLFSQWYILDWRILGYKSFYSFAANHLEYRKIRLPDGREIEDRNRIEKVLNKEYLTEKIAPYTYQVRKEECLQDLPKKNKYECMFSMTDLQLEMYWRAKENYLLAIDEFKPETIYKLFTALQHVTSGRFVSLNPKKRMRTRTMFKVLEENPRIQALKDVIQKYIEDEKCIIFAKYQAEIDEICDMLRSEGYSHVSFTGKIPKKKREAHRKQFQQDLQFLVANKACGAYGLNLQFCHNIIYYDNDFDLATRMQSEDRVHRIGQNREVNIYDICCGGSIDVFILECLDRKENMVERFKKEIKKWRDTLMTQGVFFRRISSAVDADEFYKLMGPFFASRSVRKEFGGYPLSNEDEWNWIVAEKENKIIGFVAIEPMKKSFHISSGYVIAEYRRKHIFKELMQHVITFAEENKSPITITARQELQPMLEGFNFIAGKKRGKEWIGMRRENIAKDIPEKKRI